MENLYINHLAVILCALMNLAVGAIWYSPALFYKGWLDSNRELTEEDLKKANPAKMYTISTILSLIICYNMAAFLGNAETDLTWGATAGFLAGFGWAAMIFAIIAIFEQKSLKYVLINGGYITVYFTLVGLILGAWR